MKVRVVSVGRDRSGLFQPAVDEYAGRLKHYCRFELLELAEARGGTDAGQPLRSKVRIKTMNWNSGHGAYALEQVYTVHAGQDYALGEVRFTRFAPRPSRGFPSARTPSRASLFETMVAMSMVLPIFTTTAPSACLASRPVSMVISRPSGRAIFLMIPFGSFILVCS